MRLEEIGLTLLLVTLLLAMVSLFSLNFWDSLVMPQIELLGAAVYYLRVPAVLTVGASLAFVMLRTFGGGRR